jgi:hypothetical protein
MPEELSNITDSNPDAQELYGDEAERQNRFNGYSYEDFREELIKSNAYVRKINPALHDFDGEGVTVGGESLHGFIIDHQPPEQKDKESLLKYMLETAQKLDNIQDVALLVGAGITQIHPFIDGNGRTSRLLYAKLSAGIDFFKKNEDEILGGRSSIELGSIIPNKFLIEIAKQRLPQDAGDAQINAEACRVLCDAFLSPDEYVVFPKDVLDRPRKARAIEGGMTLRDYLVMASYNLISSNLAQSRQKEDHPWREDTRFGQNKDPDSDN